MTTTEKLANWRKGETTLHLNRVGRKYLLVCSSEAQGVTGVASLNRVVACEVKSLMEENAHLQNRGKP